MAPIPSALMLVVALLSGLVPPGLSDPAGTGGANDPSTREFRYQGEAVVEERVAGTTVRRYLVDDTGSIVSMVVPSGANAGTYVVTYNGQAPSMQISVCQR